MKILGIDSSGLVATVAIQSNDILVGEYTIHNKKTHSQTLLPMIQDMLRMAEVPVEELDAIAVAAGPGSFTGLRIGAATAKGLGQALNIPLVAVPSLEGLAYNLAGADALVCPIMDARRNQAYYGIYDVSGEMPVVVAEQDAAPIDTVLQKVRETGREIIFVGDGVPVFANRIAEEEGLAYRLGADNVRYQKASSVAALGRKYMEQGKGVPAERFVPIYLRLSQAERERMEKENISSGTNE
ncbi:MAG: tRNA (adenosine(37)-N6)-threonylcarbamoyltransferase complex dimerization subunit type 1 TsaB [Eubacterium sp.]|nr:tRNA (adenosine(37)-N6)-threonylcarbamoyltransferase complex dimerization subunit type 1 TsaB [Eubacterium sp.]